MELGILRQGRVVADVHRRATDVARWPGATGGDGVAAALPLVVRYPSRGVPTINEAKEALC
jgi:hypothetical protein